ncbi:MAG: glutaredoxin-like protein [Betaproteobacteria bacterium]|nr:glutaredoxin-like protein [Betaproteobacteria bacterium]
MKFYACIALMGAAALAHGGDMYRWVDEKGVVNYTPFPPPANIRNVEPKKLGDSGKAQVSEAPYSVQLAVKNFPLTFYTTTACGEPCKAARAHLDRRGAPYTEKDPSNPSSPKEFEDFTKMSGGNPQVPFLSVGQLKNLQGYSAAEWDSTLDAAGYPSAALASARPAGGKSPSAPPLAPVTPGTPAATPAPAAGK